MLKWSYQQRRNMKPVGGSIVTLSTEKMILACQKRLAAIEEESEAERLKNWGEIVEDENRWRRLLNRVGFNFRMLEPEDAAKFDGLSVGQALKFNQHKYNYDWQREKVQKLLDAAHRSSSPEMWIYVDDLALIKAYWEINP
jgi:hypothetical protein